MRLLEPSCPVTRQRMLAAAQNEQRLSKARLIESINRAIAKRPELAPMLKNISDNLASGIPACAEIAGRVHDLVAQ